MSRQSEIPGQTLTRFAKELGAHVDDRPKPVREESQGFDDLVHVVSLGGRRQGKPHTARRIINTRMNLVS
jgi:hypothetical protein